MADGGASSKKSAAGTPAVRIGRALASPIGVIVTIPLLVIAVGLGILLLGRDATRTATGDLVQRSLTEQARSVQADVAFALDQADPLMARTRVLAQQRPARDPMLLALHDLIVGRPGVSYISISFADGTYFHANILRTGTIEVQQSQIEGPKTKVEWFTVQGNQLVPSRNVTNDYDPRKRPFFDLAVKTRARAWTPPYTFAMTFETGITCTEPVYDGNGLVAVLTVDFDINALSTFVARPALDGARTVVYTGDGTILAYPSAASLPPTKGDQLLRYQMLDDPGLAALFAEPASDELRLLELGGGDGWLASAAPIGGRRAGVAVPLDWYVSTIVPKATLLGPTRKLERTSAIASGIALVIAVLLALVLAWNLVRMRRQVAASREEARTAQARAKELGSYRLVAKLGACGMGEVWRAEHRMLARTAAIKLIRTDTLRDPQAIDEIRERFRREAQTLASMRSRNTIAIFDYGVTEAGVFYFVMELLDGVDLESLVVRFGAQPAARVIQILVQACASLAEAHDANLLHRDIKPPNLFISRAADEVDIVKLLDFGIVQTQNEVEPEAKAKAVVDLIGGAAIPVSEKLTQLGAMVGTPGFMAPEQILGMPLDGRADLYALGCCAWWLLTGEEVFRRDEGGAKFLNKHIYDPPGSLRLAMRGWCPPQLEEMLAACLAKQPEDRPPNARALAAMLRAIPVPEEHAWTENKARAWWAEYKPPIPVTPATQSNVQVIMPGSTEQRPASAHSEHAIGPTVAGSKH